MKSKDILGLIVNPYTRIAGLPAFGLGLIFTILIGFTGAANGVVFDGVLDVHFPGNVTIVNSFLYLAIDLFSLVLVMFLAGLFVSRSFRFVDILGTMTLSKAPFLILALAAYFVTVPDLKDILKDPNIVFQSTSFLFILILSFPIIIWNITLIYNAFKVSCDVKGTTLNLNVIFGLLFAEIISKALIYLLIKNSIQLT